MDLLQGRFTYLHTRGSPHRCPNSCVGIRIVYIWVIVKLSIPSVFSVKIQYNIVYFKSEVISIINNHNNIFERNVNNSACMD